MGSVSPPYYQHCYFPAPAALRDFLEWRFISSVSEFVMLQGWGSACRDARRPSCLSRHGAAPGLLRQLPAPKAKTKTTGTLPVWRCFNKYERCLWVSTSAKFLPAEAQAGSAPGHRCCALRCLCRLHLFPVLHPRSNPSDFIPHLFLLSIIPFRTISCIRNQGNSNQGISHSPSPCLISDVASLTAPLPL